MVMNFQGLGRPLNDEDMDAACQLLKAADPDVWAVLTVETRGFGFLQDKRPQILFERHVFHRLTDGKYDSVDSNISNKIPGGYTSGSGEYDRLNKAIKLDEEKALQSASWGIGQVMGFNFKSAGFSSVSGMVLSMLDDEKSQLMAVANFIAAMGLASALQRQNWVAFARKYNGPSFRDNEYDTRLAAAYAKFNVKLPDLHLRAAQAALFYLGIDPGPIDGFRGRRTTSALLEFQANSGLNQSGFLDQDTSSALGL